MDKPPRPVGEPLPNVQDISLILFLGVVMVTGTMIVFGLAGGEVITGPCQGMGADFDVATCLEQEEAGEGPLFDAWDQELRQSRTMAFSVFIVYQLFNVMNCRSNEESVFELGLFSNPAINYALLISSGLLLFFVQLAEMTIPVIGIEVGSLLRTNPLSQNDWLVVVLIASSVFIIEEFRKFIVKSGMFAIRQP